MKPVNVILATSVIVGAVCGGYNYIKGKRQLSTVERYTIPVSTIADIISEQLREYQTNMESDEQKS